MKPYLELRFRESPQTGQTCVEREASCGEVSLTSMKTIPIVESVCTGAPVCHGKEETAHYVHGDHFLEGISRQGWKVKGT